MSDDVIALMDHLGIDRADLIGYSRGGYISATLMTRFPGRFNSVILAGVGATMLRSRDGARERPATLASAMEADEGAAVRDPTGRAFREFAERSGNDLQALAAMQRSSRLGANLAGLSETKLPVMVLIGDKDTLVGSGEDLAAAIPGAKLVKIPGDHLTAVVAPELKAAITTFLPQHSPVP